MSLIKNNQNRRVMKKLSFIVLFAVFATLSSHAQIKFGIRGGANLHNVSVSQDANEFIDLQYDSGLGFHFGLTSQLELGNFFVQPEFIFTTVTNDLTIEDLSEDGITEIGKQRFNNLDIPIIAGFKFGNFKVGAGPVGTISLSSKSDLLDEYEMEQKTSSWGYQVGAGFEFDKFNVELRYEGNLSSIGSGIKIGNTRYNFDQRSNQVILSTAYYF